MRPDERDPGYIWDMVHYARQTVEISAGKSLDDLNNDRVFAMAIERSIEIIGEAANNVSEAFKQQHTDIPWAQIRGQRNVIAHMYREIDYVRIWQTVSVSLPELISVLEPLIPPPPVEET